MRLLKRTVSLFIAGLACLSLLGGCDDTSYAAQSGEKKYPTSVYAYYAYYTRDYYETVFRNYGISDISDILTEEISQGVPLYSMITDYAKSQYLSYVIINDKFDELGLSLSDETTEKIEEDLNTQYVDVYGEESLADICRTLGLSGNELKNIVATPYKSEAIMDYFFGEGGEHEITEEQKREVYESDYSRFKYIVIGKIDSEGNTLPTSELMKKMELAQEAYDKALSGEDFEDLIKEYSEDYYKISEDLEEDTRESYEASNKVMTEDGVITDKSGIIDYNTYRYYGYTLDSAVVDKLFSMDEDAVAMVEVKNAFWIIKKFEKYSDPKYYQSKENLIYSGIATPISEELMSKWKNAMNITFNSAVVNKYDPRKIKSLFITKIKQ